MPRYGLNHAKKVTALYRGIYFELKPPQPSSNNSYSQECPPGELKLHWGCCGTSTPLMKKRIGVGWAAVLAKECQTFTERRWKYRIIESKLGNCSAVLAILSTQLCDHFKGASIHASDEISKTLPHFIPYQCNTLYVRRIKGQTGTFDYKKEKKESNFHTILIAE